MGRRAVLQHVEPPLIVLTHDAQMIGNDVDDQPHRVLVQRLDQPLEILARSKLGIELRVVRDIVAVHAARPRLQDRRRIQMADSESREVGNRFLVASLNVNSRLSCRRYVARGI